MRREEHTKVCEHLLDLRGVPCPLSWAKARVRLESLSRGEALTLLLDDPRAIRDIPRAAEAAGYAVDAAIADGPDWRLRVAP